MRKRFWALVVSAGSALALFGPTGVASATAPTIEAEWVSSVTSHGATLNATIDPAGLPTKYKLQIDTTGHFRFNQNDGCVLHPPGVWCTQALVSGEPLPPGLVEPPESNLAPSTVAQHVSVDLVSIGASLQPETTYHYRAIAANGAPVVEGPDQTFTTPADLPPPETGEPPLIESLSVSNIAARDATLEATIDPNGLETEYTFYVTDPCPPPPPGGVSCLAIATKTLSGTVPADEDSLTIAETLSEASLSLSPGTKHQFWLVASNAAGSETEDGPTFFTPLATTVPPAGGEVPGKEMPGDPKGPVSPWPIATAEPPWNTLPTLDSTLPPPAAGRPQAPIGQRACKRRHPHKRRRAGLDKGKSTSRKPCSARR